MENLNLILPEIFISLSIMFLLVLGVFKKNSSKFTFNLSLLVFLITGIITINETFSVSRITLFNESIIIDYMSSLMKLITLSGGFLVLVISSSYLKIFKLHNIEYPILILSSVLGMMIMISSNDLIVFYMGLELQSLALYVLATYNRDQLKSSEAGLKYFVLSALSSGLLLYGCSLIYGFTGSTNFNVIANQFNTNEYAITFGIVFILVGLAFKISAVPFHMWAPDVYEGSPTSVTLFFTIVPKIAALTVFIRFLFVPFFDLIEQWQMILVFLSIASMLFGAIAAIGQKNLKRLIAYSSISHMGYALAGLTTGTNEGIQSSISYISIYLVMNLAFFSCIFMLKREDKYCNEKLTNAKDAFSGISLDRNFRSKIMRSKGGHMVNPSSGMVSMMTISVIDALRRVSNVEAPVFLDTPGRSLDYKHKEELLNYFWQNDGHQFLIFAHSGEFDTEETLQKHADKLAKAWSLSWPGDHIDTCYACGSKKIEGSYNSTINVCKDCND